MSIITTEVKALTPEEEEKIAALSLKLATSKPRPLMDEKKLTTDQIVQIKRACVMGHSAKAICSAFNVSLAYALKMKATQAEVTKSAAALSELEALIDQYKETLSEGPESGPARNVKSRGIALCHKDQGFSANGRSVSLLTKSVEGLRRVNINKASRPLMATKLEGAE